MNDESGKKKSLYRQCAAIFGGYYPGGAITPSGVMQLYRHRLTEEQMNAAKAEFGDKIEFVDETYCDVWEKSWECKYLTVKSKFTKLVMRIWGTVFHRSQKRKGFF